MIESIAAKGNEIFWPAKERNLQFLESGFSGLKGLSFIAVDERRNESFEIFKIAAKRRAKIVSLGHRRLSLMRSLFPEYALNSLFNLFIGFHPLALISTNLRASLMKIPQFSPPSLPYAFIDHHPGSIREIPSTVLDSIRNRGLQIVENPREVPIHATLDLMDGAQELHMVNSAPLCLSLTVDSKAPVRIHYDTLSDPVTKSYSNWMSVPLTSNQGQDRNVSKLSKQAKQARMEILEVVGAS
jgi:hypothetical protein